MNFLRTSEEVIEFTIIYPFLSEKGTKPCLKAVFYLETVYFHNKQRINNDLFYNSDPEMNKNLKFKNLSQSVIRSSAAPK